MVSEPELLSSAFSSKQAAKLLALVLATALGLVCCARSPEWDEPVTSATIDQIVDGDTVDITIDGHHERVRLLGIDTPESVARNVPRQCYGREASEALAELLPLGTQVEIYRDVEGRDRYGRLLLYLYRADDGTFVNLWLVEGGFAEAVSYPPNVAHEADFAAARHRASSGGLGLWNHCDGPDQPLN